MMRKIRWSLLLALFGVGLLLYNSCQSRQENGVQLEIEVSADVPGTLYLFSIASEIYNYYSPLDTLTVQNGKITLSDTALRAQLCLISQLSDPMDGESLVERGAFLFLEEGRNAFKLSLGTNGTLVAEGQGAVHSQWQAYHNEKRQVSRADEIDSLVNLFYAARDLDDSARMAEINQEISPIDEEIQAVLGDWLRGQDTKYRETLMGIYLLYTNHFQFSSYDTQHSIDSMRKVLGNFNEAARSSEYTVRMYKALDKMEQSAVGSMAPSITGRDTTGNVITLEDFRGKWVLVDFWASGCSWCRLETPNLQEVWKKFGGEKFLVLGVSSDRNETDWREAIAEDGAHWAQILMDREDIGRIMDDYYIQGIPQILLNVSST